MNKWPTELKPPIVSGRHRYHDVNAWLAEPGRARGFAVPPTIEEILAGKHTLILREHAAQLIGRHTDVADPASYVWYRIHTGRLEALLLRPQTWAVSLVSVERLIGVWKAARMNFGAREFHWIFGLGMSDRADAVRISTTLRSLAQKGKLTLIRDPDNAKYLQVTRDSAVALLRELLAAAGSLIGPEDWIEDRLASSRPLLTVAEAGEQLGLTRDDVIKVLRRGEIHYITSPGSSTKRFLSPESVDFFRKPLTNHELGRVVSASPLIVDTWRRSGLLVCPLHNACPWYRQCVVAYVDKYGSPGISGVKWVRRALSPQARCVWREPRILLHLQLTGIELSRLTAAGHFPALRRPDGIWMYDVTAYSRGAKHAE